MGGRVKLTSFPDAKTKIVRVGKAIPAPPHHRKHASFKHNLFKHNVARTGREEATSLSSGIRPLGLVAAASIP